MKGPLRDFKGLPSGLFDKIILFCPGNKPVVGLFVIIVIVWGVMVAPFGRELGGLPQTAVLDDDGDYHIGANTGPYIYGTRLGHLGADGDTIAWGNDD